MNILEVVAKLWNPSQNVTAMLVLSIPPQLISMRLCDLEDHKMLLATLNNLLRDESGQDLIEYALVAALIALGAIVAMKTVATGIGTAFNSVSSTLTSAVA